MKFVNPQAATATPTCMHLDEATALLERTPAALDALLRTLPAAWTEGDEGPGTWSPAQVVAHLANAERDAWIQRIQFILEHGDSQPLPPFQRDAFLNESATLQESLDSFSHLRRSNLGTLHALRLTPHDLERPGLHGSLGPVTLGHLIHTWVTHDLTHLHQIVRTLGRQTSDAVGPWTAFLGVLQCSAHGS